MNITIRTANPSDAGQLLEIFTPYVRDTAISFEYTVPTVGEFSERIGNTLKKYPYFVADADGELVGYTYAGAFKAQAAYNRAVETTIYVKTGMRRAGIGARLYERLEEALKTQGILNLNACIAYTETDDATAWHFTKNAVIRWWGGSISAGINFSIGMIWCGWKS